MIPENDEAQDVIEWNQIKTRSILPILGLPFLTIWFYFRPINKSEFIEKKNDILDKEPFVECQDCGRKLHKICVLHNESIWRSG